MGSNGHFGGEDFRRDGRDDEGELEWRVVTLSVSIGDSGEGISEEGE